MKYMDFKGYDRRVKSHTVRKGLWNNIPKMFPALKLKKPTTKCNFHVNFIRVFVLLLF